MPVALRNILGLSGLVLVESLHVLILIVTVFNFFPITIAPEVWQRYFQFLYSAIKPEREMLFYRLWILCAIAGQVIMLWWFRKKLEDPELLRRARAFALNETVFLFLLLFCVFKGLLYPDQAWIKWLFYVGLGASWAVRIFWPEVRKAAGRIYPIITRPVPAIAFNAAMIIGIIILIYPVDIEAVLARVFIQERFYHFDAVMMSPAWTLLTKGTLNIDVTSMYGITITNMVLTLSQWIGGFSYANVLKVFIYLTIAYFIGAFLFLRFWLGSFLIAAAGTFLAIKFQMFHWGVAPIIWEFFSATVVRYLFDIVFLACILHHIRFGSWGLWAACICSGISLAYMIDTGTYQWLALCAYVALLLWERSYKEKKDIWSQWQLAAVCLIPFGLAALVLRVLGGPAVFTGEFWRNGLEQANAFLNGQGALPIYTNLSQGHFFAFFMGLFIPVVYVFSLLLAAAACMLGRARREFLFVVVLCVYGLGTYHYFVCRSALSSYHAVDIPFVFLLCFWLREGLMRLSADLRRILSMAVFVLSLGALLTNALFTYYPNLLNLGGYDNAREKAYFREHFHFEEDAALIDRLTSPDAKVPLISNMETKILMEARRRPFFYYFPMIYSNFTNMDTFNRTHMYTTDRLARILTQLETLKPEYIFVEERMMDRKAAEQYFQDQDAFAILMGYVQKKYEQVEKGKYLFALRRKGGI